LSLHDRTSEKASSADEVLVEHFGDDVFDVGDVDLVGIAGTEKEAISYLREPLEFTSVQCRSPC
jgi:hypothetical protein